LIALVAIDSNLSPMSKSSLSGDCALSMKATLLDLDIDISFRFVYGKGPEVNIAVSCVPTGLDAVFEAVPRAHDVHIRFVPILAMNLFCVVHYFDDTRQYAALADRPPRVSAGVFVGIELVVHPKDTDCELLINVHNQAPAVRKRIAPADEHLSNSGC
jgi:hypothetical protein